MRCILVTQDQQLIHAAQEGFHPSDELVFYTDWRDAFDNAENVDLMIVDLLATLEEPHRIAGYEKFAESKMSSEQVVSIPLIIISPPEDYKLDFMTGYPDFVLGNLPRPVTAKMFRRASTWV